MPSRVHTHMPPLFVDDDRKTQVMLSVHANKLRSETTPRPGAYILHANSTGDVSLEDSFMYYTKDEVKNALDTEKRSVQWLMRQITVTEKEEGIAFVAGVLFANGEVLCHVFPIQAPRQSTRIR